MRATPPQHRGGAGARCCAQVERALPVRPYDVLFSMPWAGPLLDGSGATGGAETQIVMLARGLAATGMSVGLLVAGDRSQLPRELDGVHVLAQPRVPAIRFLGGFLHDLGTLSGLVRRRA